MAKNDDSDKIIDDLTLLCLRGQEISSISDLGILLEKLLETALEICDSDAASILLLDEENDELYFKTAGGDKSEQVRHFGFNRNKGIAGHVAESRKPALINDITGDPNYYRYIDELVDFRTEKLICVPLLWESTSIGVMEVINKKDGRDFTEQDLEFLTILANHAGASLHITSMTGKLQNFFINMLEIMMMGIETLTSNQGHSVRVARMATMIARELNVSEEEFQDIYYASLIHGIGRIKMVRDRIKGGEKIIPVLGAEMIRPIKMLSPIADIIEAYEERWDGSGSPKGLRGEEIPLSARILGFAEEYEEWREEQSLGQQNNMYAFSDFSRRVSRTHDPEIFNAFRNIRKREREKMAEVAELS